MTSADLGSTLGVLVTAANSIGSSSASAVPTVVVTAGMHTWTFSGNLGKSSTSFAVTVGPGSARGSMSFSARCSSGTLTVKGSGGTVVAQGSGPSASSR